MSAHSAALTRHIGNDAAISVERAGLPLQDRTDTAVAEEPVKKTMHTVHTMPGHQ